MLPFQGLLKSPSFSTPWVSRPPPSCPSCPKVFCCGAAITFPLPRSLHALLSCFHGHERRSPSPKHGGQELPRPAGFQLLPHPLVYPEGRGCSGSPACSPSLFHLAPLLFPSLTCWPLKAPLHLRKGLLLDIPAALSSQPPPGSGALPATWWKGNPLEARAPAECLTANRCAIRASEGKWTG